MKQFYLFFSLLVTALVLRAEPLPGVPVNGPIVPVDSTDVYSTFDPWWGKGGLRMATNMTAMLDITPLRREAGMLVYVRDTGEYWRLNNDLTSWTYFGLGGNVYNTDGFLNSNRTINGNGFDFTLNNTASMRLHAANLEMYSTGQMDIGSNFRLRLHTPLYGTSNVWSGMVLTLQDNGDLEYKPVEYTGTTTYQTNRYTIIQAVPNYFGSDPYPHGLRAYFTIVVTNTGPSSLKIMDGPAWPIVTPDKQPLVAGQLKALSIAEVQYSENLQSFILQNGGSGGGSGTTIIVEAPTSDVIFLKDFGAVGDGFTDDTTAFRNAIAASANRTLDIGKGLYVIQPTTITNNVSIIGHHVWGTIASPPNAVDYSGFLKKASTSGHMLTVAADVRVELHYVYLDGNKANNVDAAAYNIYFPASSVSGECLLNHIVVKNSKGGGILDERDNVRFSYVYNSDHELHGLRNNATGTKIDFMEIGSVWGDGILIDSAEQLQIANLRINETQGHSINVNGSMKNSFVQNARLSHAMKSALRIGATFQNNSFDTVNMWGANAQQNAASSTNGAYPQGTWSTVLYDSGSYALDKNKFANCQIGGFHPTLSGTYGTRKVKYNIEWLNGSYAAGYQQDYINCIFAYAASTATGNFSSGLTSLATIIGYKDDVWDDTGFYLGKHMKIEPTNGVSITTMQTTLAGTEYPMVWDPTSMTVKTYPTNYSLAFTGGIGWVPADPRRVIAYAYEDYITSPSSALGSYQFTGTATVGGSFAGIAGITNHPGLVTFTTSASTNGGYSISGRGDSISFDAAETWTVKIGFRLRTALSTPASDYAVAFGFGDLAGAEGDVDAVQVRYTDNVNSGNWTLIGREASVTTTANGTTGPAADIWQNLVMTLTTSTVSASVNGVTVGTVSSNIPDGANKVSFMIKIYNTGRIDPNTSHVMELDYFQFYALRASDR